MLYCLLTLMGPMPNGYVPVAFSPAHLRGANSPAATPMRKVTMELPFQLAFESYWTFSYGNPKKTFCLNWRHLRFGVLNVLLELKPGIPIASMSSRHLHVLKHPI